MAKLSVKLVEEKLRELSGNAAAVGRAFGVTRSAVTHYIQRHPSLRAVAKEARETMKDNAESALYKAVLNGEAWAVCFYLKTQARDRGYTERVALEGSDNPLEIKLVRDDNFYGNADRLEAIDNGQEEEP
jgi:predicted transcriptional regulator